MNLALAGALEKRLIRKNDKVIYVNNESISVKKVKEGMDRGFYKMLFTAKNVDPDVVKEVLDIAIELGKKGREGKPVGSTFIIGDAGSERAYRIIFLFYSTSSNRLEFTRLLQCYKPWPTCDSNRKVYKV